MKARPATGIPPSTRSAVTAQPSNPPNPTALPPIAPLSAALSAAVSSLTVSSAASSLSAPSGAAAPRSAALDELAERMRSARTLVLSGAGISTESGIPDYRGPSSANSPREPMRYQQFVSSEAMRRRYWARSAIGWPLVRRARPNDGHRALARLEAERRIGGVLTQNVDGLHQAAGSRAVLELHGSLAAVRCLSCRRVESRRTLQRRLIEQNPALSAYASEAAPDGDADLPHRAEEGLVPPGCSGCGGVLKPDVVFFGENVPAARLAHAWRMYDAAQALLVVGSSLTVFSGFRFVRRAAADGKFVAILNDGPTRGDPLAQLKIGGRLGTVLPALARRLAG